MSPHSVYSFPLLKVEDILHFLKSVSITINVADLKTPNASIVRRMLELFVEDIMGISKEELQTPQFVGLENLEYPELHEESIPELGFFRAVVKMMMACGVLDFSIVDLVDPEGKRFRKQLSALINFTRFRNERMGAFSEVNEETKKLMDLKKETLEKQIALKEKLQELRSQRVSEEPAMVQIKEACSKLEEKINVLNKEQAVLRNTTSELKEACNVLRDEVSSKQYAILDKQQEAERLTTLIVNSPARVKKEIKSISTGLDAVKEDVNVLERKERVASAYHESLLRVEREIRGVNAQMEDIEEVMTSCTAAKADVKEKRCTTALYKASGEEAIVAKERLERLLNQKTENLTECKELVSLKLNATEEAIASATSELNEAKSNTLATLSEVSRLVKQCEETETSRMGEEAVHGQQMNDLVKIFDNVSTCVTSYNASLLAVLPVVHIE